MELLNLVEAAERIGCKPKTLRTAAREGRLVANKVSRDWVVTPEALEEWRGKYWMVGTSVPRNRKKLVQTP